jgi:hypothetical protein
MRASLFLAMALFAAVGDAQAQGGTRDIATNGVWTAYGGRSETGTRMCGMRVIGSAGRSLHVKWFEGNSHLTVQAFREGWRIPHGTRMPVSLRVDRNPGWDVAQAFGTNNLVEWRVTQATFDEFSALFRLGSMLTVSFPAGSEEPWVASLRGSAATYDVFAGCILRTGRPPQPHDRPATGAVQPFGGAPSQPFAPPPPSGGEGMPKAPLR